MVVEKQFEVSTMPVQKFAISMLAMLALVIFSTPASSQQRPDYGTPVDSATAKRIAVATIAACRAENWNVAVAVVDNHGFLVYFERMDNTQTASAEIAQIKASAAATYRRPTRAFAKAIANGRTAIVTFPGIVASPGGMPILKDGKVIGGVGVSGVTGDQDEQCAKAGLAAM
ncbi:MAG: heme-binding protein [Pseudomonadota bacterium]